MKPTPIQHRVMACMAAGAVLADAPERPGYLSLGPGSPIVPRGTFNAMRCAGWLTARHCDGKTRYVLSNLGKQAHERSRGDV